MAEETTKVSEVDIDIDQILNPGESVMVPGEEKPSIWSRKEPDMTFIDKDDKTPEDTDQLSPEEIAEKIKAGELNEDGTPKVTPPTPDEIDEIIGDDDGSGKTGRPRLEKDALLELTNKLIEKKMLIPFDDEKPLDKYSLQDFEELIEANFQEQQRRMSEAIPAQFYQSLPPEMQYAAKYIADGGQDLKGLFRMLAATEEVRSLDPAVEGNDEAIVRTYLQATRFGDDAEIQEEIDAWKDRDELEAKAKKFKPKLDAMQEHILADKVKRQEDLKIQQEAQSAAYMESVYQTLEPGELNGIKLDRKTQGLIYAGLTQPNYPSVSGKNTNLLGHLLEKHQFVEPRHDLIAEALWLLADPEGYKSKVREGGKNEVVEKTVRTLKTEESRRQGSSAQPEGEQRRPESSRQTIPRPGSNFFKR